MKGEYNQVPVGSNLIIRDKMNKVKDFKELSKYIKNPIPLVKQLMKDSPYPVMVVDKKYKIRYLNENVLRLYRVDYSRVLYKNFLGEFSSSKEHYLEMNEFFETMKQTRETNSLPSIETKTSMLVVPLYSQLTAETEFFFITHIVVLKDYNNVEQNMNRLNNDYGNFAHHLSSLLEAKDKYTALHSSNVEKYSLMLGKAIGMTEFDLEILRIAASIHDVGKIKIPNTILNKPGKLTDEEFHIIKNHAKYTSEILGTLEFFDSVSKSASYHHERYDGKGYLEGLKGEEIPLMSRIMAIADAFDAMTTDRSYRRAMTVQTALDELSKCKWTQFDPYLVDKFANLEFDLLENTKENFEYEYLNIHTVPEHILNKMNEEIIEFLVSVDVYEVLQYVFSSDIYGVVVLAESMTKEHGKYEVIYQNHFIDKLVETGAIPVVWEPCLREKPKHKCSHCFIDTCMIRKENISKSTRLTKANGENMYLDVKAFPYREMSTDSVYVIEILRDATAETEIEKHSVVDFFHFIDNLYIQFADSNEGLARIHKKLKPLSTWLATKLEFDEYEIELLHKALSICDLGIISLADSNEFKYKSLTELRGSKNHIEIINDLIKEFKSFRDVKDIVLHHHNFYNEKPVMGNLVGNEVPIHSYIIATSDYILTKLVEGMELDVILNKLESRSGLELSPQIADVLLTDTSRKELAAYIESLDDTIGK